MECNQIRPLIAAHLDGELDVVNDAKVVEHLDSCPACAALALAHASQQNLIREKLPRYAAPADLRAQIQSSLPVSTKIERPTFKFHFLKQIMPAAACLALALFAGFHWGTRTERQHQLAREIISNHIRALTSGHVYDVASSDRHTVKPWFADKLDFAPVVPDLASEGFPLLGGRFERLDDTPTATLVYGRRKHLIDLYVWKSASSPANLPQSRDGYQVVSWTQGSLAFVAVSDLSLQELVAFTELQKKAGAD